MPNFSHSNINFDIPPAGIYVAQVANAKKSVSKNGNEMITLSVSTLPDGFRLKYFLVFGGNGDGLITQFGKNCEGELGFPADSKDEFILTAADTLFRIVFAEIVHETPEGKDQPQAKIKFGGILPRAKALARAPELVNVELPSNVPGPRALAILPARENRSGPQLPLPDDDIPF